MSARNTKDEPSARARFLPKKILNGKSVTWRVYDIQNGSFPYQTKELGLVAQDLASEALAQQECDRLTDEHGGVRMSAKERANRPPVSGGYDPEENAA